MAERVLSVRLRAIVDGYNQAMGQAALATEKVAKAGSGFESIGKKMTIGFSTPMVAAGGFALKSATNFESAFSGVRKTVDGTAVQLDQLRSGIIGMARELPSSREEIAGVAEAAGQLGIEIPNILSFSRVMIDLGNATDVTAQDAAMSLAQLANITGMSQKDFSRLGSSIVDLGNNFATTESRIIDMSHRLASAGTQIGLTEPQILGVATALSSVGIEAEAGGTAFSKVMISVAKSISAGGGELQKWADISGMASDSFADLFRSDAAAAISKVITGLGDVAASGQDLFGVMDDLGLSDARVGNAMRSLAGNSALLTRTIKTGSDAWNENTALAAEADLRYATVESRMKITANRATDVARQFGEVLFPAVNAALNVIAPLADGMAGLVHMMAAFPDPVKIAGASIAGIAVAAGPTIWALGKLAGLYAPLTTGALKVTGQIRYLAGAVQSLAATKGVSTLAASIEVLKTSALGLVGPWIAITAGVAAVGAAMYLAKRSADNFAASHRTAAEMTDMLTASLGLQAGELRKLNDEKERGAAITDEQVSADNKDLISTLNALPSDQARQDRLIEIGWRMQLEGQSPDDIIKAVERLARITGVEIPTSLILEGVDDFQSQVDAATRTAAEIADVNMGPRSKSQAVAGLFGGDDQYKAAKARLTDIAQVAADAYQTGNIEGFIQILGETEIALGDNGFAVNALANDFGKLSGVQGLSLRTMYNVVDVLEQMSSADSSAPAKTKERIAAILEETSALEGDARVREIVRLATERGVWSLDGYKEAGEKAKEGTDGLAGAQKTAEKTSNDFAASLDALSKNLSLARIDFDAGNAAAQAFADAIDMVSRTAPRMSAGLRGGAALKSLHEGLTGQKQIADIMARSSKETDKATKSVDRLGDAARRADPRMSALQARLDTLAAAGQAFSEAIDNSSMLDDQISSALSLGDAYATFSKTYRRLPQELDMVALATGKLRPRTAEAIQNMLGLGRAARDYLTTMIEMGETDSVVAGTAGKMRDEYRRMFTQMGMTTEQANRYIEAMGLMPDQITTAIRLSGMEAASTQLNAYISLLEGRIPAELATSIIAQIDAGDIEGAAKRLADYARSNPALIEVQVDEGSVSAVKDQIDTVKAGLWDLPKALDPMKAMLGEYTDAQQAALDAVMQFGDGVSEYLSRIAHDGNYDEVRAQAKRIQDAFLDQIGAFGIVGDAAENYLDLIGLSDWQIESAITLTGDTEAIFRIQTYSQLLADEIPPEVATEVATLIDQGKLQEAADALRRWRESESAKPITIETILDARRMNNGRDGALFAAAERAVRGHATGGLITGPGTSTSDSITRRVSNGEYVLSAAATKKIGPTVLDQINRTGVIPGTAVTYGSQPIASVPDRLALDDKSLDRLAALVSGRTVNLGGVTVVAPSPKQVPRRLAESVGSQLHLAGL